MNSKHHSRSISSITQLPDRRVLSISFGLLLACAVIMFWLPLEFLSLLPHEGYVEELTVAGGMQVDSDKLQDMRFTPLSLSLQVVGMLAILFWWRDPDQLLHAMGVILVGAAAVLAVVMATDPVMPLQLAAIALAAILTAWRTPKTWQVGFGHSLIVATALTLGGKHLLGLDPSRLFVATLPSTAVTLPLAGRRGASLISAAGAACLAVAMVCSAPSFWLYGTKPGVRLLDLLHLAAAALLLLDTARHILSAWRPDAAPARVPALGTAFALFLLAANPIGIQTLSADDYHFGEKLLAARNLFDGGWFVDFFSPHGLSDAVGVFIADLFGNITATNIQIGDQIFIWYAWALALVLLVRRAGPLVAVPLALFLPQYPMAIFVTLNLLLVIEALALRRPVLAGVLGVSLAAAGVFFNSGPGAVAAIVGALSGLVLHGGRGKKNFLIFVAAGIITGGLLVFLFWPQILGQIHFLKTSAAMNLTIYGNGDIGSMVDVYWLRFLYVAAPVLTLILLSTPTIAQRAPKTGSRKWRIVQLGLLLLPPLAFALILNAYTSARLDNTAERALQASVILLVFMPVWLAHVGALGERRSPLVHLVFGVILCAMAPWPALGTNKALLPPGVMPAIEMIATDLPELGTGNADPRHVDRIFRTRDVVDKILKPNETFVNFTNRNAYYFYLDRPNPVPIASSYNAAPKAFQRDMIQALGETPPPLALVGIDTIVHDGLSLPLRSHLLYEYLQAHYESFTVGNAVYGIRKDLTDRLERPEIAAMIEPQDNNKMFLGTYSDANWSSGLAIGENATRWTFAVAPQDEGLLRVGEHLDFGDGVIRVITEIAGPAVRTEPTIDPAAFADMFVIHFKRLDAVKTPSVPWSNLQHKQLFSIPSAWGRSMNQLSDEIRRAGPLPLGVTINARPIDGSSSSFDITGSDPQWFYPIHQQSDNNRPGLLALTVSCRNTATAPQVQVFWRSSDGNFTEQASIVFTASGTRNLVPLDSSPYWTALDDVAELRIDVSNPGACPQVELTDVAMYAREP